MFVVHLFTCFTIYYDLDDLSSFEDYTMEALMKQGLLNSDLEIIPSNVYFTQFYFITTTMTTVGYGDLKAKPKISSMILVMSIQFLAMLAFSKMKEDIFSLKSYTSTFSIVENSELTTKEFLASIERTQKFHDEKSGNVLI